MSDRGVAVDSSDAADTADQISNEGLAQLAGAPISWGVCELPSWGLQLDPERVLAEMAAFGLGATELGPLGWLPTDATRLREQLDGYGLDLVAGFIPIALDAPGTPERVKSAATQLADAGAELLVAAIVQDLDWPEPIPLSADGWARAQERLAPPAEIATGCGVELIVHPYAGSVLKTKTDVELTLAATDVRWCLDTGHLPIGGTDPVRLTRDHGDRVAHGHRKDVDAAVAARLRAGELDLMTATQAGLFKTSGTGAARVDEVIALLDDKAYTGRLVLEQDCALGDPQDAQGPAEKVSKSINFVAKTRGGVSR